MRVSRSTSVEAEPSPYPALAQPADLAASVPINSTRGSWALIARSIASALTRNIKKDPGISGFSIQNDSLFSRGSQWMKSLI